MTTSEQINDLAAAMCKAQATMKPAVKDATNPAYRSRYADLAAVWDACRGPLTANGITCWQDVTLTEHGVSVTTRLVHTSGQWVEFGPLVIPLTKHDAHGVGSACSYGKRYALSAALAVVAEEDDDGMAAVPHGPRSLPPPPPPSSLPPPPPKVAGAISDAQRKRMFAIAKAGGHTTAALHNWLGREYGLESTADITTAQYEAICKRLEDKTPLESGAA